MKATPLFLGACALASIAGVVGGTTIDTRPIQHGGIGMNEIVRPAIDLNAELSSQPLLPDHYAMNTPEGRVDVAELSTRGLYAQNRYGMQEAAWTPPPITPFEEVNPWQEDRWQEPVDPDAARAASAAVAVAREAQQAVDEAATPQGEARLINVDQALAAG